MLRFGSITTKGQEILTKLMTDEQSLTFTKIVYGDRELESIQSCTTTAEMTAVLENISEVQNPKAKLKIKRVRRSDDIFYILGQTVGEVEGFAAKEAGLYAKIPNTEIEVLFGYFISYDYLDGILKNTSDYVCCNSDNPHKLNISIRIKNSAAVEKIVIKDESFLIFENVTDERGRKGTKIIKTDSRGTDSAIILNGKDSCVILKKNVVPTEFEDNIYIVNDRVFVKDVELVTKKELQETESPTMSNIFDKIYPIGTLYWSSKPTNPSTLFGGTWKRIKDKFILAAGDNYEVNETGGNETVTLTEKNLPSHTHSFTPKGTITLADTSHSHSGGMTLPEVVPIGFGEGIHVISGFHKVQSLFDDNARYKSITVNPTSQSHSHTFTGSTGTTGSKGDSNAFSIMPPYETKYCWERTA